MRDKIVQEHNEKIRGKEVGSISLKHIVYTYDTNSQTIKDILRRENSTKKLKITLILNLI